MSPILIVTATLSVIVAAILVHLEYRKRRPVCPAHHFGSHSPKRVIKFDGKPLHPPLAGRDDYKVVVKQLHVAECQHEGCEATREKWRPVETHKGRFD